MQQHIVWGALKKYHHLLGEMNLLGSTAASRPYCNCGLADDGNSGMRNANTSNVDNEVVVCELSLGNIIIEIELPAGRSSCPFWPLLFFAGVFISKKKEFGR